MTTRVPVTAMLIALAFSAVGCAAHQQALPITQGDNTAFRSARSVSGTYLFAVGSDASGCAIAQHGIATYSLSGKSTGIALNSCYNIAAGPVAFDRKGNLYAGCDDPDGAFTGAFCEYAAPLSKGEAPSVVVPQHVVPQAGTLATDSNGDWYAIEGNAIVEYASASKTTLRRITQGVKHPVFLALDSKNNLYVANSGDGTVTVYKPGSKSPWYTIRKGLRYPVWLAFDGKGNLYVANNGDPRSVAVFGPGAAMPLPNRTIEYDIVFPIDMVAIDASNDLYVAIGSGKGGDEVAEYQPGTTAQKRMLTSSNGICHPASIAVDAADNLYVANQCSGGGPRSKLLRFGPSGTKSNAYGIQPYSIVIAKSVLQ